MHLCCYLLVMFNKGKILVLRDIMLPLDLKIEVHKHHLLSSLEFVLWPHQGILV